MKLLTLVVAAIIVALGTLDHASLAATEIVAAESLTIQANGPRTGKTGKDFFNVEGKENAKYASFGVLVFDVPRDIDAQSLKGLTLTLVQNAPKFAKPGTIKLFLAPALDPSVSLKFDAAAPDGVGQQIANLEDLGSAEFKDPGPGKPQSLSLNLSDAVRARIAQGGKLYLVVIPADPTVAATYHGASSEAKEKSPKLTLD